MPTAAQLDAITLALHREALARARRQPELIDQALKVLVRWDQQRGVTASEPYLQQWKSLLTQGVDAVERATCTTSDLAATLRNTSPLGFILTVQERKQMRSAVLAAH
jgi:hypothetical protein